MFVSIETANIPDTQNSVRTLKEEAHSQKMADAAVGLGRDDRRPERAQVEPMNEVMKDVVH